MKLGKKCQKWSISAHEMRWGPHISFPESFSSRNSGWLLGPQSPRSLLSPVLFWGPFYSVPVEWWHATAWIPIFRLYHYSQNLCIWPPKHLASVTVGVQSPDNQWGQSFPIAVLLLQGPGSCNCNDRLLEWPCGNATRSSMILCLLFGLYSPHRQNYRPDFYYFGNWSGNKATAFYHPWKYFR